VISHQKHYFVKYHADSKHKYSEVESKNMLEFLIDWLMIDYLRFYVPLKNFSFTWRHHHYRWRAAKFMSMLGAQGLWAGRDLYRATPAVTRYPGFSGLIRKTAPISRLLRHTWRCGGSIPHRKYLCSCWWTGLPTVCWNSHWYELCPFVSGPVFVFIWGGIYSKTST
jgi:hypothetical protein